MNQELIEKALKLCGKTMDNMATYDVYIPTKEMVIGDYNSYEKADIRKEFSIEKFAYYLLSPEFIEKWNEFGRCHRLNPEIDFLYAIQDFQDGNEKPLEELLSKI